MKVNKLSMNDREYLIRLRARVKEKESALSDIKDAVHKNKLEFLSTKYGRRFAESDAMEQLIDEENEFNEYVYGVLSKHYRTMQIKVEKPVPIIVIESGKLNLHLSLWHVSACRRFRVTYHGMPFDDIGQVVEFLARFGPEDFYY